jgi:hypothetical protein
MRRFNLPLPVHKLSLTTTQLKKMLNSSNPFKISLHPNGSPIVIDECCSSLKLTVALLKAGFAVEFLGKKKLDSKIIEYLSRPENSEKILITYDVELDSRLPYHQCILLTSGKSASEHIHVIKKVTETTMTQVALC